MNRRPLGAATAPHSSMRVLVACTVGMVSLGGVAACTVDSTATTARDFAPLATSSSALSATALEPTTKFYAPPPGPDAVAQFFGLVRRRHFTDAFLLASMVTTPHAVWFTGGTPDEVREAVRTTVAKAACEHRVPVLVAYNIPYRDCAQYSAGGAVDTAAYQAWIDAFAEGIDDQKAVVILEPDSLGLIPYNTTIYGATEKCQPTVVGADGAASPAPGASPVDRYAQLNYAVDKLGQAAPAASLYLDGTHAAWLGVGEAAFRLAHAGVARSAGFYLNVSNYELTEHNTQFGTWVSQCITAATAGPAWAAGHFDWCPSQYNPATGFALDYSDAYAATVTAGLAGLTGGAPATTHFVIDTSRNGQGPWVATPGSYSDPQVWCNPPKRGVGLRPSADTGQPLVDAYLWVKVPGESDGACNRGVAGATTDPEWGGNADPGAGTWFPEAALELARLGVPPLR